MEPLNNLLVEAPAAEAAEALKTRAIESFISLREDIPPKPLFPNAEDPSKEQRENAEHAIRTAVENGIILDDIQKEAISRKKETILAAHIKLQELYYDTDGFALNKLKPEQITQKASLESAIKTAGVWKIDLDEIEIQAKPTIEQYATQKKGAEIKAAQQADLDMWRMCDRVILEGRSIHNLEPENQQIVERAKLSARRVMFGHNPTTQDEVEKSTTEYRLKERPVFLEKAHNVVAEIKALQEATGTKGLLFRLGDITQAQLDTIHRINNFVFYTKMHYRITASELGVDHFTTLGVHEAYQGAKLKNS